MFAQFFSDIQGLTRATLLSRVTCRIGHSADIRFGVIVVRGWYSSYSGLVDFNYRRIHRIDSRWCSFHLPEHHSTVQEVKYDMSTPE